MGAALTSTGVLALLALTRVLPVDPRRWRDNVGGGLERLRGVVDRAYDVATYLRLDPTDGDGVRTRIIRRYRAVLRRLEGDYDEIVIVAHSQGTILTIATLFGDAWRRYGEVAGSPWGVRPWADAVGGSPLTGRLRGIVTMGSPFRQTYEARLPGQYDWLDPARPDLAAADAAVLAHLGQRLSRPRLRRPRDLPGPARPRQRARGPRARVAGAGASRSRCGWSTSACTAPATTPATGATAS